MDCDISIVPDDDVHMKCDTFTRRSQTNESRANILPSYNFRFLKRKKYTQKKKNEKQRKINKK